MTDICAAGCLCVWRSSPHATAQSVLVRFFSTVSLIRVSLYLHVSGVRPRASLSSCRARDVEPLTRHAAAKSNLRTGRHQPNRRFVTGAVTDFFFADNVFTGYDFDIQYYVLADYVVASAFPFSLAARFLEDVAEGEDATAARHRWSDRLAEQRFSQFPTEGPSIRALCLGSADFGKVRRSRPQSCGDKAPGQSSLWILAQLSIWILECPTLWVLALRSKSASYFVASLRKGLYTIAMYKHYLVLSWRYLSAFIFRSRTLLDGFLESIGSGCSTPRRCPTMLEEEVRAIARIPQTGSSRLHRSKEVCRSLPECLAR